MGSFSFCTSHFSIPNISETGSISFPENTKFCVIVSKISELLGISKIDISPSLSRILVPPVSQNFETYRNFLARICEENDGVF